MVYITGDTHGQHDFLKMKEFAEKNKNLTKSDFVIVLGDFGAVWNESSLEVDLKPYEDLPFTVLFIDGNHENFDLLNAYPVEEWKGGKVHKIKPSVIHLMRGQVFEIEGKTILTFGGASSIDRAFRTEGASWWKQETPSYSELDEAIKNLKKVNFKVDYILTHSCDEKSLYYPIIKNNAQASRVYPENMILSYFENNVDFSHWYFGHFHENGSVNYRKTVLYGDFVALT